MLVFVVVVVSYIAYGVVYFMILMDDIYSVLLFHSVPQSMNLWS